MSPIDVPPPGEFRPDMPTAGNGSLGAGIALAWVIAVVGTPLCGSMMAVFSTRFNEWFVVLWLLPYLFIVVLAIFQYRKGKTRTGLGLMLGLVSMIAVALLLVAACFGMFSTH
ncbi:hypothetical protein [Dyella sp.]|uniref:hypothetical protein n=1 Tax=Dyella sp. TaxID=1869338 RepID=UPI002D77C005|nr:hypothetical protein [Dyella sp.]HET7332737.1 hypothetical protein [Dyella sp.]